MASPISKVVFNSFEQLLSTDVNRLENLSSREIQNLYKALFSGGSGFTTPVAYSGFMDPPSLSFFAANQMTLGAGSGFFVDGTGVTADDSNYQVIRWASQVVTFAAADPVNPRIDLVVATPAQVQSDSQVRNILVNPVTRAVSATSIFKTQDPVSTIAVVTGTAAGSPVPPSVPAGAVALFEVYVPGAAATAADFTGTYRLFKLSTTPANFEHTVLKGCALTWNDIAGSSVPYFGQNSENIAIIDGEMIQFGSFHTPTGLVKLSPQMFGDGLAANDPFTTAGPAGSASPYYVYLCGGRNLPQQSGTETFSTAQPRVPVVLVASRVAPDLQGRPSTSITTPRGALSSAGLRRSALYVGMGFTASASTTSIACRMTGPWVSPIVGTLEALSVSMTAGIFDLDKTFASQPSFARTCRLLWSGGFNAPAGISARAVFMFQLFGATLGAEQFRLSGTIPTAPALTTIATVGQADFQAFGSGASVRLSRTTDTEDFGGSITVQAYPHQAPRLDANAGLSGANV